MQNKIWMKFLMCAALGSCAFAPFSTEKSGSTIGQGKWALETGMSPALYGKGTYGISENFDASLTYEFQLSSVIAADLKYSIINNKEGFALAGTAGIFNASNTDGYTAAFVASYKAGWFEPFINARYNKVKWDKTVVKNDVEDSTFDEFTFDAKEFSYMQYTFGFNFWTSARFGIAVSGRIIDFIDGAKGDEQQEIMPGISFMWRN